MLDYGDDDDDDGDDGGDDNNDDADDTCVCVRVSIHQKIIIIFCY